MKKIHKMRRIAALVLIAAVMCASLAGFAGCGERDENDKGATLIMYLAGDPSNLNLDPAKLIYSAEAIKFMGLIFEGMMKMDENGKLQNGMCKKYTIIENESEGIYKIQFELKETKWSDGKPVSADDFVFAWKRILEPEFTSPAAPLLYQIRNARYVKEGDMTVDDLGVYALDETLLEVVFDRKIDYNQFLENLTSIALVPLRSDTVDFNPEDWARKPMTLLSNGPFAIKQMEYNKGTTLERSTYYLLNIKEKNIMKYVKPYKLSLDFSRNLGQLVDNYINDDGVNHIFYLGDLPSEKFAEFESKAVLKDLLSAYTYHFNTSHSLLGKQEVRKALSIALDRNEIAKLVGLGVKPATGIVPAGIIDAKSTDEYRAVRGGIINPAGDINEAKSLLSSAGVNGGSFELKVRDTDVEKRVAEYAKSVWGQLGFNVTVTPVRGVQYSEDILTANYDVMGYDNQALGIDAFSVLAPFAKPFCGGVITFLDEGRSEVTPYITGFQNNEYDALIEDIFNTYMENGDNAVRTEKLFNAEKKLFDLSPVAPLYFNVSINITDKITGLNFNKFGFTEFAKANLKNYQQYETTTEDLRETIAVE